MITANQIKAARALLDMKQTELAERAKVSLATVNNIERGINKNPRVDTIRAIRGLLENCGIVFTEGDAELGVVLRRKRGSSG